MVVLVWFAGCAQLLGIDEGTTRPEDETNSGGSATAGGGGSNTSTVGGGGGSMGVGGGGGEGGVLTYRELVARDAPIAQYTFESYSGATVLNEVNPALYVGTTVNATISIGGAIGGNSLSVINGAHLDVADGGAFDRGVFSLEVWVKPTSAGDDYAITHKGNSLNYFAIVRAQTTGQISFHRSLNGSPAIVTGGVAPNNVWTHIVAVSSADAIAIFVDGAGYTPVGSLPPWTSTAGDFNIGSDDNINIHAGFAGLIDEVAYYDMSLDGPRIAEHYVAGLAELTGM